MDMNKRPEPSAGSGGGKLAAAAAPQAEPTPPAGRPWLRWVIVAAVVLALGYWIVGRSRAGATAAAGRGAGFGAMPVTAEAVRRADLNVTLVALGTVTPVRTVTLRSRVDGALDKIYFKEGQTVEAGAPIADLDPRPFQVQKMQAAAQLAKDTALLENARVDLQRFQTLLAEDSVAEQQVVTQAALVRQYEAALKVDQAQVESAALQLAYAHITAPLGGRIGLRAVDEGNIVHSSDANGIAVITQLRPITVLFAIPQDSVQAVLKNLADGDEMVVDAYDRDGRTKLAAGKLMTMDNQVDPATGTVRLRAVFPNADDALFPNQFVNVQLVVDRLEAVPAVSTAAVQHGTVGTYVYVVGADKKVALRKVEVGPSDRGLISISKGLAPGELVVVDGVDKLREGSTVELVGREAGGTPAAAGTTKRAWSGKRPDGSARPTGQ